MRGSRFLVSLVLLLAFIAGGASPRVPFYDLKDKEAALEKNSVKKFSSRTNDNLSLPLFKRKARCTEVETPHIQIISFERIVAHKVFDLSSIQNNYRNFLYCVRHERGPPLS